MLVQENLPGPEYSIDVLADAAGKVHRRGPPRAAEGRLGHRRHGADRSTTTRWRPSAGRSPSGSGSTGVANVQAKQAVDGEPALLEVNPRFPGTMPLTVASGVDMPALCVAEALGEPMPAEPIDFEPTAMVRVMREHYMPFSEIEAMREAQAALVAAGSQGDAGEAGP